VLATQLLPASALQGAIGTTNTTERLLIEGKVLRRNLVSKTDPAGFKYVIQVEQITGGFAQGEVFTVRVEGNDLTGSLFEGSQAFFVLEPLIDDTYRLVDAQLGTWSAISSEGNEFPGAGPEHLVDGIVDAPGSSWTSRGAPNWVDIDLGAEHLLGFVSVAPYSGSPGGPYFYNEGWTVQFRDGSGELQHFSNVQKSTGAGTLLGIGITVGNGDPGTTQSLDSYKNYEFGFTPVSTRYLRFTVTAGDSGGDSNGAELEARQVFVQGSDIHLQATATDPEDGDLTTDIVWVSALDGPLGSGGDLTLNNLSVGTHSITASVTDSDNRTSQDSVNVIVVPDDSIFIVFSDPFESGDTSRWSSAVP
jgi:hypothetical protein